MEKQTGHQTLINNAFYDDLREDWYSASDHPVALLRAENAVRTPWICSEIEKRFSKKKTSILDVGCGAGLLTNALAIEGHRVTGVDLSASSLQVASRRDTTRSVDYLEANAYCLPFPNHSFDVVCAMDVLEHVEEPSLLIAEASRVLKSGGIFFFHTFNRNFLSYLFAVKGLEWCFQNSPKHIHVYPLFIKPKELKELCASYQLHVLSFLGLTPKLFSTALLKLLFTRKVPSNFQFQFSKTLRTGYCGIAQKSSSFSLS